MTAPAFDLEAIARAEYLLREGKKLWEVRAELRQWAHRRQRTIPEAHLTALIAEAWRAAGATPWEDAPDV